ncbi:MAG: hypothetical protein HN353_14100 [Bdellovibrionales bacterium]|nr:hypothetical protein [Bdellovibrionales bacterium]MBT3527027.1 hypothetical protein [Bdellovibrionales bacterium]MBT7669941.1 hypothetical protein [Bdellovibrionales bacterium]MBT7768031.1 hypothetical protein [Bdellovibrionales bacterium]
MYRVINMATLLLCLATANATGLSPMKKMEFKAGFHHIVSNHKLLMRMRGSYIGYSQPPHELFELEQTALVNNTICTLSRCTQYKNFAEQVVCCLEYGDRSLENIKFSLSLNCKKEKYPQSNISDYCHKENIRNFEQRRLKQILEILTPKRKLEVEQETRKYLVSETVRHSDVQILELNYYRDRFGAKWIEAYVEHRHQSCLKGGVTPFLDQPVENTLKKKCSKKNLIRKLNKKIAILKKDLPGVSKNLSKAIIQLKETDRRHTEFKQKMSIHNVKKFSRYMLHKYCPSEYRERCGKKSPPECGEKLDSYVATSDKIRFFCFLTISNKVNDYQFIKNLVGKKLGGLLSRKKFTDVITHYQQ